MLPRCRSKSPVTETSTESERGMRRTTESAKSTGGRCLLKKKNSNNNIKKIIKRNALGCFPSMSRPSVQVNRSVAGGAVVAPGSPDAPWTPSQPRVTIEKTAEVEEEKDGQRG